VLQRIAALEGKAFGRGGLNEWHLPVVARQGRLYVLESGDDLLAAASVIRSWPADLSPPPCDEAPAPRHCEEAPPTRQSQTVAYLIDFVVSGDHRGRGFGRRFLQDMVQDLKKEGVGRLGLTVAPDNVAALSLYRSAGFKRTAHYADEYGSGRDRWLLELTL
jgi:ribosomal protein S18 acetylase RimI-like enzyme